MRTVLKKLKLLNRKVVEPLEMSPKNKTDADEWRARFITDICRRADARALADPISQSNHHQPLPMAHVIDAERAPNWEPEPKPYVSVVLGTLNRLPLLKKAVSSIRENGIDLTYEIIVVDGGSHDGTLAWLLDQADILIVAQNNWKPNRNERRRSWGYFMNLGFRIAQGKWIAMISDDSVLVPGAIANAVRYGDELSTSGREIGGVAFYFRNWPDESEYYVQSTLGGMMMVNHGLFLKSALVEVDYAEEKMYAFYKCDSDLALKLWSDGYEVVDCDQAFVEHLVLPEEVARISNNATMIRDRAALIERWKGVFVHPEFPYLFKPPSRKTIIFNDELATAETFRSFIQR